MCKARATNRTFSGFLVLRSRRHRSVSGRRRPTLCRGRAHDLPRTTAFRQRRMLRRIEQSASSFARKSLCRPLPAMRPSRTDSHETEQTPVSSLRIKLWAQLAGLFGINI